MSFMQVGKESVGPPVSTIHRVQDIGDGPPVVQLAAHLHGGCGPTVDQAMSGVGAGVVELECSDFWVDPAVFSLAPANMILPKLMELQGAGSPMCACLVHTMIMLCSVLCAGFRCVEWAGV